jgi:hypothetical protein
MKVNGLSTICFALDRDGEEDGGSGRRGSGSTAHRRTSTALEQVRHRANQIGSMAPEHQTLRWPPVRAGASPAGAVGRGVPRDAANPRLPADYGMSKFNI